VDVLVVRHAVALNRDEANELGVPDAERPLTKLMTPAVLRQL
jgi:hypothetical protein